MSGRLRLDQIPARFQGQIAAQLYPEKAAATPAVPLLAEPSESKSQQSLIRWWSAVYRSYGFTDERVLMAFPLQGARTKANGARLKAEGMRRGTNDVLLCCARGGKIGLWLENKTSVGKLTPEQKSFQELMRGQGYEVAVARSFDEAQLIVMKYLRS